MRWRSSSSAIRRVTPSRSARSAASLWPSSEACSRARLGGLAQVGEPARPHHSARRPPRAAPRPPARPRARPPPISAFAASAASAASRQRAKISRASATRICSLKLAVALGRARLPLQRGGAQLHVGEDLVEPDEVGLGRAQFLLGILAADVEAGNPGRLLQHQPALGRLGGDHRADLALADQGRASARRSPRRRTAGRRPSARTSRPLTR